MDPKLLALIVCITIGLTSASSQWSIYKRAHGKSYADPREDSLRKAIFEQRVREIAEFNAKHAKEAGYRRGLNHLSDFTPEELERISGEKVPRTKEEVTNSPKAQQFLDQILLADGDVPDEVDWRKVPGRVMKAKDQSWCLSSWAFATTGVLEGQMAVQKNSSILGRLVSLSEQNLIDCSPNNDPCHTGLVSDALAFISEQGGIDSQMSYPYEAKAGKCRFNIDRVVMRDTGYAVLTKGDEQELKKVVASFGPVAARMMVTDSMILYDSGIYFDPHCNSEDVNESFLIVGYGTDPKSKQDYWIVKNCLGSRWGETGYFRLARNRDNHCGIATFAVIPTF